MRPSLLFAAAAAAAVADAAYCGGAPSPNAKMNEYPINTQAATLLNQTANGKAYLAGQPGYEFYLLHVYGTAYEVRSTPAYRGTASLVSTEQLVTISCPPPPPSPLPRPRRWASRTAP